MTTFTNLTDSARVLLNDVDKIRYADADLLEYANEAMAEARRIRPDLFLGKFKTAMTAYAGSDDVPLSMEYHQFIKDYVISRGEFRDDEFTVDGRAGAFLQKFRNGMLSA
jgi:hypothetical protein